MCVNLEQDLDHNTITYNVSSQHTHKYHTYTSLYDHTRFLMSIDIKGR